jgi:hypothetical protein
MLALTVWQPPMTDAFIAGHKRGAAHHCRDGAPDMTEQVADPRGCRMLHRIRALAHDLADSLRPACEDRFDGVERMPASAAAVAEREEFEAMIRVISEILGDPELARRFAALLCQA